MELCRCCLSEGNIRLNSFSDGNIVEIITFLGIICQNPISNFPRNVCNSCDLKLKDFANFKEQCTQSEEILRERFKDFDLIKTEDCSEDIQSNLQENNKTDTEPNHPTARRKNSSTQKLEKIFNESEVKKEENVEDLECFDITWKENSSGSCHGDVGEENLNDEYSGDNLMDEGDKPPKILQRKKDIKNPRPDKKNVNYPYRCRICDKGFRFELRLNGHLREHEGKPVAVCEFCNREYNHWAGLFSHLRKNHSDETKYSCCGKTFLTDSLLEAHQVSQHSPKEYICELCGKTLTDKAGLIKHRLVHTDETPFKCKNCDRAFKSQKSLRHHEFRHTGVRNCICEICEKPFVTRQELKYHMLVHTNMKAFKCNLCEKEYRARAQLIIHKRSHSGEKPYKCDICGQSFTMISSLKTHNRLHTGERPCSCELCGRTFVSRQSLRCHVKRKHTESKTEPMESATTALN